MPSRRVFTGQHVFLDGALQPATLLVDLDSGKIERVLHAYYSLPADRRAVFTDVDGADWVDSGDKYIIPGLVECVSSVPSLSLLTAAFAAPMCT